MKTIAPPALRVQFADRIVGKVQFEHSHLTGGFATLREPIVFEQAYVADGAVAWPGELDLPPDAIYMPASAISC